ncbi:MAG: UDP-3-O-(3-hydroxymyristoyl)glucosamine N-acyltransferase [Flavobacteriales bacterium]|nr:UDP-3-O-(3-hydroxymyristoyl)glucosamine N-acyltransferase [Flavobacteriales bacterium]MCB9196234.1 UDP-3-O-(3-hydroxymyristoyl)glucosamine N-acyltransferase [Flavobacteriales bacterium]
MKLHIQEILRRVSHQQYIGDSDQMISNLVPLDKGLTNNSLIAWCSDKNTKPLEEILQGTIIVSNDAYQNVLKLNRSFIGNAIIVSNPRSCFAEILRQFFIPSEKAPTIADSVKKGLNVEIGNQTSIGENVVLGDDVKIGDHCKIGHNTVILANTEIANNCTIGSNCTIGGVGFGYEKNDDNIFELIPHIGNVFIDDFVEIGNNVCIDRAVLGSTIIGKHSRIDNLVHIAHGVKIGQRSMIIANAMIAGSTEIGDDVWVAPSASVMQKKVINDRATVGLGSVILKDIEADDIVAGVPAKSIKKK